jgi:hypothetical protein
MWRRMPVAFEGSDITLSMVEWGVIRRSALFLGRKFRSVRRTSPTLFVPSHEVAIYDGSPEVVFSKKPYITFYFAKKEIAQTKFEELVGIMQKGGLYGGLLSAFMGNGDPREQGCLLGDGSMVPNMMFPFEARPRDAGVLPEPQRRRHQSPAALGRRK